MADIDPFRTPEGLTRPDIQTSKEREDERLQQLETAAKDNVEHEFTKHFAATDVGGNFFGSGFELADPTLKYQHTIRDHVFNVLKASGVQYKNTIDASAGSNEFSRAENFIWRERRQGTYDDIQDRTEGARSSLLVTEGFDKILGTTISTVQHEYEHQQELAERYFEQRGFWAKLGGGWRKARFERFSRIFLENLEIQKNKIQVNIDRIKSLKKASVDQAERRVKAAFAQADDATKPTLWAQIRSSIATPATIPAALTAFGIPDRGTANTDFLEAIKNLEFIEGDVRCRRSEALDRDAQESLTRFGARENKFRTTGAVFESLRDKLKDELAIKPAEEAPQLGTLMDAIEKDLLHLGVNLLRDVYGKGKIHEEITAEEKFLYFVRYLNSNLPKLQNLDVNLKRQLLAYINNLEKETKNDYENMEPIKDIDEKTEEALNHLKAVITGATTGTPPTSINYPKNLKNLSVILTVGGFKQDEFDESIGNLERAVEIFDRNNAYVEQHKGEVPSEDRKRIEAAWGKMKESRRKIEEVVNHWKEEAKKYQELLGHIPANVATGRSPVGGGVLAIAQDWLLYLQDEIKRLERERSALSKTPIGGITGMRYRGMSPVGIIGGAGGPSAQQITQEMESKDREIAQYRSKTEALAQARDNLQRFHFTNVKIFDGYDAGLSIVDLKRPKIPASAPLPDFNTRIRNRLQKSFLDQVEQQYLKKLETNTTEQFAILQKVPEGATVRLRFRETTNLSNLQMPQDLGHVVDSTPLRVIRREKDCIILENDRTNDVYVLNGPSVKSGKAQSNLGVYHNAPNPAPAMGAGPGTNPNFTVPHSNPNQQAIVLSMHIS